MKYKVYPVFIIYIFFFYFQCKKYPIKQYKNDPLTFLIPPRVAIIIVNSQKYFFYVRSRPQVYNKYEKVTSSGMYLGGGGEEILFEGWKKAKTVGY